MDASDAAEYVQELAGENANIIFGATYDDTKSDEVTPLLLQPVCIMWEEAHRSLKQDWRDSRKSDRFFHPEI